MSETSASAWPRAQGGAFAASDPVAAARVRRIRAVFRERALALLLALGLLVAGCSQTTPGGQSPPSGPPSTPAGSCSSTRTEHPFPSTSRRTRPPLFRVQGNSGATLYLLGTVHLGPVDGWILSPAVRGMLDTAETIVVEVDLREADEENVSDLVMEYALFEPGVRLEDRIEPETRALLEAHDEMLTRFGFPPPIRSLMKPWFLAVGITESLIQQTRFTAATALDHQILAAVGGRELIALETAREQMDLFDKLPPAFQDRILRDTLSRLDEGARSIEDLVRAWRTADLDMLACLAREGVDALPELEAFYEILLDGRNRRWLGQLEELLEAPGRAGDSVLIAVGALHLVGEAGLPELLRQEGYGVQKVGNHPAEGWGGS